MSLLLQVLFLLLAVGTVYASYIHNKDEYKKAMAIITDVKDVIRSIHKLK